MAGFLTKLQNIINADNEFQLNGFKIIVGDFLLNPDSFTKTITLFNNGNTDRLFKSVVSNYDKMQIQLLVVTKGTPTDVDDEVFRLYQTLKKVKGNRDIYIINVEPPIFVNKTVNGIYLYNIFMDCNYNYEC